MDAIMMELKWKELTTVEELERTIGDSMHTSVLFFKHSTRCGISRSALKRFEREWSKVQVNTDLYFIDLLAFRTVSNKLAEISGVKHESPQVIVLKNDEVLYAASHENIDVQAIVAKL